MKKLKELFKFLFITEQDKGMHFTIGIMLGIFLTNSFAWILYRITEWPNWMIKLVPVILAFSLIWAISFIKEMRDENKGGIFNYQDIKWTMIGGIIGILSIFWFV